MWQQWGLNCDITLAEHHKNRLSNPQSYFIVYTEGNSFCLHCIFHMFIIDFISMSLDFEVAEAARICKAETQERVTTVLDPE